MPGWSISRSRNKNIKSFERYARKHQVRYHIEKELGTDPPKWMVYFKANQADALTAAFKGIYKERPYTQHQTVAAYTAS